MNNAFLFKIYNKIKASTFFSNIIVLVGGVVSANIVTLLASPIITRLYHVDSFGVVAVYISLLSFISVIASLCYEFAIPLPEDDESAINIFVLSIFTVMIMSSISSLIIVLFSEQILTWANMQTLKPYIWLLPIGLLGAGTYKVLNYWAIRSKDYRKIAKTRINQGLSRAISQIGLGLARFDTLGLIIGEIFFNVGGTISLAKYLIKKNRDLFGKVSFRKVKEASKRYKKFPLIASGSQLLNTMGWQLPPLFLATIYGAQVTGWFYLVIKVASAPMGLLGNAVAQVYYGNAPRLISENPIGLKRLFLKTTKTLFLVGIVPIIVLAIFGPQLFSIIFGSEWEEAGIYARIMAPAFLMQLTVSPLSMTANLMERQDMQFIGDLIRSIGIVILFTLAKELKFSSIQTICLLSGIIFFTYLLYFFIYLKLISKNASSNKEIDSKL